MAADFIFIGTTDTNARDAGDILQVVAQTRNLMDLLQKVIDEGFRQFESGPPVDFAEFELRHGIPTGKGQTVFDLLNGTLSAMKGESQNANALELRSRVG